MVTRDESVYLKDSCLGNYDNQYTNLNLNQNYKCVSTVQSHSKFTHDVNKVSDNTMFDSYDEKDKSWNKSAKSFNLKALSDLNSFIEQEKDTQKRWMTNSSNANNSTLSLHIATYENSVGANDTSKDDEIKCVKKRVKKPFEFLRQDQRCDVEVIQFKSSQRLFNPNLFDKEKELSLIEIFRNIFKKEIELDERERVLAQKSICLQRREDALRKFEAEHGNEKGLFRLCEIYGIKEPVGSNAAKVTQNNGILVQYFYGPLRGGGPGGSDDTPLNKFQEAIKKRWEKKNQGKKAGVTQTEAATLKHQQNVIDSQKKDNDRRQKELEEKGTTMKAEYDAMQADFRCKSEALLAREKSVEVREKAVQQREDFLKELEKKLLKEEEPLATTPTKCGRKAEDMREKYGENSKKFKEFCIENFSISHMPLIDFIPMTHVVPPPLHIKIGSVNYTLKKP
uniref:Uncharacterized protein n=1 Tax=Panagrolaimus sp. ES5 TaxID=591445 RepID=A0AC34FQV8_9BILA